MVRIFPGRFEAECGRGATDRPVRDIASCIEMRKAVSFEADPVSLDLVISRILAANLPEKTAEFVF